MLTTDEIYERVRAHIAAEKNTSTASDYALAKALGICRQSISARKHGRTLGMGDATAMRAADILGLSREYILSCVQAERAERLNSPAAETWRRIAETFTRAAAVASFFVLAVTDPRSATAGEASGRTISPGPVSNVVYYVKRLAVMACRRISGHFWPCPRPLFA